MAMKRVYRICLEDIPPEPRGLEVKVYDHLTPILRWHGREIIIVSDYEADLRGVLVCFYYMETESVDGRVIPILKKREAKVAEIEFLKSSSYYWRRE